MRCAQLVGAGRIEVGEMQPEPRREGHSLVRVTHVAICGSDLHTYRRGGIPGIGGTLPLVLGHEGVGVVEEGPHRGRAVSIEPTIPCRECEQCLRGNPNLCLNQRFLSLPPEPGLLREHLWHPPHLLEPLPEGLAPAAGTVLEPLGVALHAFDLLKMRGGSELAIIGCGGLGLCCLLLARHFGATRVVCTDVLDYRCAAAKELGADEAINPKSQDIAALGAFEYIIEASGDAGAHGDMLQLAKPGAKIAVIGTPPTDEIVLAGHSPRRKGLTFYMVRRSRDCLGRAAAMAGSLPLSSIVTHTFDLEHAQEAFDTASEYRNGCLRVVIEV
jgi:L-iditol 2-dehydrogenase